VEHRDGFRANVVLGFLKARHQDLVVADNIAVPRAASRSTSNASKRASNAAMTSVSARPNRRRRRGRHVERSRAGERRG
jgi:hypothetical protein